jgi:hypothetical protein
MSFRGEQQQWRATGVGAAYVLVDLPPPRVEPQEAQAGVALSNLRGHVERWCLLVGTDMGESAWPGAQL